VYSQKVSSPGHPLVRDINSRFDAPHSRFNTVDKGILEEAGVRVLAESDDGEVHLSVSPDLFRWVYFQGHPEYDASSLLKEYKREVFRYLNGELDQHPAFPENYLTEEARQIARQYLTEADAAKAGGHPVPEFPEPEMMEHIDNTWGDTGKAIVNNWLGLVYRKTNLDRTKQFMDGVNPDDPLDLKG
jgi:homoserine O-succinyltransferase